MSSNFSRSKGFSFIELIVGLLILSLVLFGVVQMTQFFGGSKVANISARLQLQMEARRALVNLYTQAQEGIELLKPDPGSTLPFFIVRDFVNDLHFFFLRKDAAASERCKTDLYRLFSITHDIRKNSSSPPHEIVANVKNMKFTAFGFSAVVVTGTLQEGESTFSFVNMIRLRNTQAEDAR